MSYDHRYGANSMPMSQMETAFQSLGVAEHLCKPYAEEMVHGLKEALDIHITAWVGKIMDGDKPGVFRIQRKGSTSNIYDRGGVHVLTDATYPDQVLHLLKVRLDPKVIVSKMITDEVPPALALKAVERSFDTVILLLKESVIPRLRLPSVKGQPFAELLQDFAFNYFEMECTATDENGNDVMTPIDPKLNLRINGSMKVTVDDTGVITFKTLCSLEGSIVFPGSTGYRSVF
jgi:hypothetical protein